MKKAAGTIGLVVVFLVGLLIMLYPTLSEWYNDQVSSRVVESYRSLAGSTSAEDQETMLAQARAYNETLSGNVQDFINGAASNPDYIASLDFMSGVMGYINIEKIGVSLPIYHGTDEGVLQKAIGHLEGSHLPTGDVGNHTVLTGHSGLPSAMLFTDLTELVVGDEFTLQVLGTTYRYAVRNIYVVEPHEVENLAPQADKDLVTLITCTPYGVNSHRLLVQGERVYDQEVDASAQEERPVVTDSDWDLTQHLPAIGVAVVALILMGLFCALHSVHGKRVRGRDGKKREMAAKPHGGKRLRR